VTIAVLATSGSLTSLQLTLIIPVLAEFPAALGISTIDASWIVTITLLCGTVGTPIITRLADMYGRRRMLLVTLALLVLGSVIAAVGMSSFAAILIGRALQGFSTAIIPIGISLLREQTSPARANTAGALMSASLGVGAALGLPASGLLAENFGLASLFWSSAVAGSVFVVLVAIVARESARAGGRFDIPGAALLTLNLACLLLVISEGAVWGWTSPAIIGLSALTVVGFAVWVPLQLASPAPVVDLRLNRSRPVLQTNIASFFAAAAMFANHLLTTQQVMAPTATGVGLGMDAIAAGLTMVPASILMVALSPLAGFLINRWGGGPVLTLGCAVMCGAFVVRFADHSSLPLIVVGATMVGVGTAIAFSAMPALIAEAVPVGELAAANGISSLARSLGNAVSSAAFALGVGALPSVVAGIDYLSPAGLSVALGVAGGSAGLGAVIAFLLPRPGREARTSPVPRPTT
jgi:MFS family permease